MERYETGQDVLDEIWNQSRKENFFDSDSNFSDFEENSGGKKDDETIDSHDSEGEDSFDGEYSSDEGQESSRHQMRQTRPRQQQPKPVWRIANGTPPSSFPFTANTGVKVLTAGFEAYDYFALYINDILMNFATEANHYTKQFTYSTNPGRSSHASDWYDTAWRDETMNYERVVVDLMHPFLEVGYHLHTNNWYTSLPLYTYLHQHGTLACGTIRSNQKGLPQQVKNAKVKKGEVMAIP